ncbi:peptidase M23B [Alkalilimnicola ehrlichii MLHE-1]|uniref:Peptidase M23B n=2 Tax=Alkalilimnicola ehrlichii TaxID=351052 RepID=Q0A5H8_ALKEH|nr:peptidase M23B [Alkalilimnicola ehrlichii MLHE-1]
MIPASRPPRRSPEAHPRAGIAMRIAPMLLLITALTLVSPLAAGVEDDLQATEAELEAVRERIEAARQALARDEAERDAAEAALEESDRRVQRAARALRAAEEERAALEARVAELEAKMAERDQHLRAQRERLARQLRAVWQGGRDAGLRVLLNQQDPSALQRLLAYHSRLDAARRADLVSVIETLERLQSLEQRLQEQSEALARAEMAARERRAELAREREQQRRRLARLEASLAETGEQLMRMEEDEQRLQGLLDELAEELAAVPERDLQDLRFREHRGALPWPVEGRLGARFGDSRELGNIKWRGLVIDAENGTEVQAVATGQVVYADWFRGLGLLVILDHGDGYLSLYGYNESLFVEEGEWVQAGAVLASVGASGGRREPGLYFEVRADGDPVDPLPWLAAR